MKSAAPENLSYNSALHNLTSSSSSDNYEANKNSTKAAGLVFFSFFSHSLFLTLSSSPVRVQFIFALARSFHDKPGYEAQLFVSMCPCVIPNHSPFLTVHQLSVQAADNAGDEKGAKREKDGEKLIWGNNDAFSH